MNNEVWEVFEQMADAYRGRIQIKPNPRTEAFIDAMAKKLKRALQQMERPEQGGLFEEAPPNGRSGAALAAEGIARSEAGANRSIPGWSDEALLAVFTTARRNEFLVSDDIREAGVRIGLQEPHNPSAWGGVIRRAMKAGYIEKTGDTRASMRPVAHKILRPVYRSLIWQGAEGGSG